MKLAAIHKSGTKIIKLLQEQGFEAFFVGGTVRNIILGQSSDNVDIATNAKPDEVQRLLTSKKIKCKPFGIKFGTILAIVDKNIIEITTFRSEGRYSDSRHPDKVTFITDYKLDAKRRDFTINSMYLDPSTNELLDPENGVKDLQGKIIRFVGDPKHRIDEDPLRMFRAARFATTLGFKIEKNSFAAIKVRAKLIQKISGERIKQELDKILLDNNNAEGIRLLDDLGILKFIIPDFSKLKLVHHNSKTYHLEGSVYEHTLLTLSHTPKDLDIIYAMLFHDLGKVSTKIKRYKDGQWVNSYFGHQKVSADLFSNFAQKFHFPRKNSALIKWLIIHHDDRTNFKEMRIENKLKYVLEPSFTKLLDVWYADSMGNKRLDEKGLVVTKPSEAYIIGKKLLEKLKSQSKLITKLANGKLILKYSKIKPGPQVKSFINKIIVEVYNGNIKTESDVNNFLKDKNNS